MKEIIKNSFNNASGSYENSAIIQQQSALFLVEHLIKIAPLFVPKTILDVGSGTGIIPEILFYRSFFSKPVKQVPEEVRPVKKRLRQTWCSLVL